MMIHLLIYTNVCLLFINSVSLTQFPLAPTWPTQSTLLWSLWKLYPASWTSPAISLEAKEAPARTRLNTTQWALPGTATATLRIKVREQNETPAQLRFWSAPVGTQKSSLSGESGETEPVEGNHRVQGTDNDLMDGEAEGDTVVIAGQPEVLSTQAMQVIYVAFFFFVLLQSTILNLYYTWLFSAVILQFYT